MLRQPPISSEPTRMSDEAAARTEPELGRLTVGELADIIENELALHRLVAPAGAGYLAEQVAQRLRSDARTVADRKADERSEVRALKFLEDLLPGHPDMSLTVADLQPEIDRRAEWFARTWDAGYAIEAVRSDDPRTPLAAAYRSLAGDITRGLIAP